MLSEELIAQRVPTCAGETSAAWVLVILATLMIFIVMFCKIKSEEKRCGVYERKRVLGKTAVASAPLSAFFSSGYMIAVIGAPNTSAFVKNSDSLQACHSSDVSVADIAGESQWNSLSTFLIGSGVFLGYLLFVRDAPKTRCLMICAAIAGLLTQWSTDWRDYLLATNAVIVTDFIFSSVSRYLDDHPVPPREVPADSKTVVSKEESFSWTVIAITVILVEKIRRSRIERSEAG